MLIRQFSLILLLAKRFARSLRADGFARFTTIVSILSVALGSVALIIAISVLHGYEEKIEETAMRFTSHIEAKPIVGDIVGRATGAMSVLRRIEGVRNVDMVLNREALARTRAGVDGIVLSGVTSMRASQFISPMVIQGSGVTTSGAVIGESLAKTLKVDIDDTLVVYAANANASQPILFTTRVGGILRSGMATYDNSVVVLPIETVRQKLRLDDDVASSILVTCTDITQVRGIASRVRDVLGPRAFVQTYLDTFQAIAAWIDLQKKPIPIVLGLISIVAVFTVISTLLIAVVEKTRSIAILMAIGMTPWRIMLIFLIRSVTIGALGSSIGAGMALAFLWIQSTWHVIRLDGAIYYVSELPVSFSVAPFIIVPAISIGLCVIVAIVPMVLASRISPSRALRFS
ncbi:MAG: FtsX-like permease family protein [Candidatus Kapabacteria bacterium]|nr:FtsX-like permease family protein [Candidatus Kapabacteria bacterium]